MGTDAAATAPPDGTPAAIHGCDGMVLLRGIAFRPAPALWRAGIVHIAYVPDRRVSDVSTLLRIIDANARLFSMQERLTVRIAEAVDRTLRPRGVAVAVEVAHQAAIVTTSRMLGAFRSDADLRREFRSLLHPRP
ncbi:GTP cyclohydrolase I [Azospirillum rugosum]